MMDNLNLTQSLLDQHKIRLNSAAGAILPPWAVTMIKRFEHKQWLFNNAHLLFCCAATGRIFTVFSPELEFSNPRENRKVEYSWHEPKRLENGLKYNEWHKLELIDFKMKES